MSIRRTLWDVVRDTLGRRNDAPENVKRTRVSRARFERDRNSLVAHPERDLSEWVRPNVEGLGKGPRKSSSDWEAVVRGEHKEK